MRALIEGRSALAVFPTGGGKSLCCWLPAVVLEGLVVVVSPLVALMKDQVDALRRRGIAAARWDGTLDGEAVRDLTRRIDSGELSLLYVAPERFHNERFLARLSRTPVAMLAIDEAHCISEWGHNFRPDYLLLAEAAKAIGARRVLAMTATATPAVVADIRAAFGIEEADAVVTGFHRQNLVLRATACSAADRANLLVERLRETLPGPTIVYVTLQRTAEQLSEQLRAAGFPAEAYHAGMDPDLRAAVQERWMRSDDGIVVATIAFGMGIDKADVRRVFHANLPKSLESYSQEVGRAGRDGLDAVCEVLASPEDLPVLRNFAYGDTPSAGAVERLLADLAQRAETFDVSLHDLAGAHDIRPLVLRTLLTYLEIDGVLKPGTPFHAGYEWRFVGGASVESVAEGFGIHGMDVRAVFGAARKGRVWWSGDPDRLAQSTGLERSRVVRILEVLADRGFVELRVSDVRWPFTRCVSPDTLTECAPGLIERFAVRERTEVERIDSVVALLTGGGCIAAGIAEHFGDRSVGRCGRCSACLGSGARLPAERSTREWDPGILAQLRNLAERHPAALSEARQQARFLCGVSSPATTRARLSRHALVGIWAERAFPDVLLHGTVHAAAAGHSESMA